MSIRSVATVLLIILSTHVAGTRQAGTTMECLSRNGLGYGPLRDGQNAGVGVFPTVEQIDDDLAALRRITRRIRTYSSVESLGEIPRLARKHGMRVTQGIHLEPPLTERERKANEAEIQAALNLAKQGLVESLVVGNETLTMK